MADFDKEKQEPENIPHYEDFGIPRIDRVVAVLMKESIWNEQEHRVFKEKPMRFLELAFRTCATILTCEWGGEERSRQVVDFMLQELSRLDTVEQRQQALQAVAKDIPLEHLSKLTNSSLLRQKHR